MSAAEKKQNTVKTIIASFNYLTYILAFHFIERLYPEIKKESIQNQLQKFNENNDFGRQKLGYYPFILTIGNGNRIALMKYYNYRFSALSYGVVQRDIFAYLRKRPTSIDPVFIEFNTSYCMFLRTTFTDKNSIAESIAIEFKLSEEEMPEYIRMNLKLEESLQYINEKKIEGIANANIRLLTYWTTEGFVHKMYRKFYDDDTAQLTNPGFVLIDENFNQSISQAQYDLSYSG